MARNIVQSFISFLILFAVLVLPTIRGHYLSGIAKNDENSPTNQLTIQQQQHQLVQHKPNESEDGATDAMASYVSVRGEDQVRQHSESYDKKGDVDDDVHTDNDDMLNKGKVDHYDVEDDDEEHYDEHDEHDDYDGDREGQNKNEDFSFLSRKRRELSDWLIAPNTKWCGRGNNADGRYNHLGGASAADKCCRRHDHCKMFIPSMSNRYELFNYRPYTLSHCSCDRRFRTCLKMANDEDANTIGKLFFNMVQSHCFIVKTEKVCQQRAADGTCQNEIVKQKGFVRVNKRF